MKVRVTIFPFLHGRFSLISNATDFFIHSLNGFVLKKKKGCALLVFINLVPYMQLSHIIPGVTIMGRKVSVASVNGARESGGVLRPQWGP